MRSSATFMCRPEGHCCLVHAVGPVGVIRDRSNLEIPPPSGKAITTEALQVRSCCNAHHESKSLNARQRHIHVSARSLEHAVGPVGIIRDSKNSVNPNTLWQSNHHRSFASQILL